MALLCLSLLSTSAFADTPANSSLDSLKKSLPNLIAHAGGAANGYAYTNSLEALDTSYKAGHRFIELDFYRTDDKDGNAMYALVHDKAYASVFFGKQALDGLTSSEFVEGSKFKQFTFLTARDLQEWLLDHNDVAIIGDKLDAKQYAEIAKLYPTLAKCMIPQVNSMPMYNAVKRAGYSKMIWTVYATAYAAKPKTIVELSSKISVIGITMPYETSKQLNVIDMNAIQKYNKVYVHTINSPFEVINLRVKNVTGYYTDHFTPHTFLLNW